MNLFFSSELKNCMNFLFSSKEKKRRSFQDSHEFLIFIINLKKDYSKNNSQTSGAEQALVQRKHKKCLHGT